MLDKSCPAVGIQTPEPSVCNDNNGIAFQLFH